MTIIRTSQCLSDLKKQVVLNGFEINENNVILNPIEEPYLSGEDWCKPKIVFEYAFINGYYVVGHWITFSTCGSASPVTFPLYRQENWCYTPRYWAFKTLAEARAYFLEDLMEYQRETKYASLVAKVVKKVKEEKEVAESFKKYNLYYRFMQEDAAILTPILYGH